MMKKDKKSHGVQLLLKMVVTDPDGKVLSDTGQKPSKSFVIQFLEFFKNLFDGTNTANTDITGAESMGYYTTASLTENLCSISAGINDSDFGIVIGTGDTAVDNEDYVLETQLTEGVGAGQITHGAQVIGVAAVVGVNVDQINYRPFINNTGSTITVKEAGVYIQRVSNSKTFLIVRDVLAPPIEVPDKCSLMVMYTFRTTV